MTKTFCDICGAPALDHAPMKETWVEARPQGNLEIRFGVNLQGMDVCKRCLCWILRERGLIATLDAVENGEGSR